MKERKIIKLIFIVIIMYIVALLLMGEYSSVYGKGSMGWYDGARSFITSADSDIKIDSASLNKPSSEVYNILTSFGMIVAVAVGLVLGIQYMISGAEEKAEVKQTLLPYMIGCIVTFGAFGIWKILINTFIGVS